MIRKIKVFIYKLLKRFEKPEEPVQEFSCEDFVKAWKKRPYPIMEFIKGNDD